MTVSSVLKAIPWGWILVLLVTVVPLAIIGFISYFRKKFNIDIDLLWEYANGSVIENPVKLVARVFTDGGIRKIQFAQMFNWKVKENPPPMADILVRQANGRWKARYWRHPDGTFSPCRATKRVPIEVEIDKVTGEISYKEQEIIITPQNEEYREFAKMALKKQWERHKDKHWMERYGGIITVLVVAVFCLAMIGVTVWFLGGKMDALVGGLVNAADKLAINKAVAIG